MLDIGLFELLIVGIVTLLVVGPQRMPHVVRTIVGWVQRIKQFVSTVQRDIEQDIKAEEIKQSLEQIKLTRANHLKNAVNTQNALNPLSETMQKTQETLDTIKQNTNNIHKKSTTSS